MIGIVKKTSHFGNVSYITVSGIDKEQLVEQVEDLNHYGDLPEISGRFTLIAYRDNGQWFLNNGEMVSNEYISALMNHLN